MQQQELFSNYEIKSWEYTPHVYKIIAISAVFNILALLVVAQSNLLTTKGCDSPLVGRFCQVLDTIVVGSTLLGTDSESVNQVYEPTELEDAEITFIDLTGAEKFQYPEGYFALANPEMAMMNPDGTMFTDPNAAEQIPGIPAPTTGGGNDLLNTTPQLPPDNPNAVTGTFPSSPFSIGGDNPTTLPRGRTPRRRQPKIAKNPTVTDESPDALPNLNANQTADNNAGNMNNVNTNVQPNQPPVKSEPVADVKKNSLPLQHLVSDILANKQFDLNKQFAVKMEGVLARDEKDGIIKFDKNKSRFVAEEGDEAMRNVVKLAIERLGDSGWLGYLQSVGIDKINFTVVQDGEFLKVDIVSEQPTPERAKTVSSAFGGFISAALVADKNNLKKLGDDERTLLSSAKVTSSGKQFVLNFALPKADAKTMIDGKLEEARKKKEEEAKQNKPIGSAGQNRKADQSAAR